MTPEHHDKIREANRRRGRCPNCQGQLEDRDGKEVGGMPGIKYRYCNSCGWCRAKTTRPQKFKF